MIVHIALYKFKSLVCEKDIQNTLQKVKNIKDKCSGIMDIFAGNNYHKESKNLTHGIVVLAQDQESLDNYRAHPLHKKITYFIESIEDDGLGFDFKDIEK